jgi:hypothetical protein
MPYTLWSRGRLIGHTDLGFARFMPKMRMGWFHPTPEGERVMPIVVGMPPAMHAYVNRARELTGDATAVQAELDRSTEGADLSAAFQHHEALELQLRRDDGSVIRTEDIGVVDTHRLIELSREPRQCEHVEEWSDVGDLLLEQSESERQLEEDIDHDVALIREWFGQSDGFREWAIGEVDETKFPRYQIQVELFDDAAIP